MVHYKVFFTVRSGVEESRCLTVVGDFLQQLTGVGEVAAFRIFKDSSYMPGGRTGFQALVEFSSDAAFARAIKNQQERGIHQGAHGAVVAAVSDFRVEVVRDVSSEVMQYACEI